MIWQWIVAGIGLIATGWWSYLMWVAIHEMCGLSKKATLGLLLLSSGISIGFAYLIQNGI